MSPGFGEFDFGDTLFGGGLFGEEEEIYLGPEIFIGGIDYTFIYAKGSLSVRSLLNATNTAKFQLVDTDQDSRPVEGQLVEIQFRKEVIFRGTVDSVDGSDDIGERVSFYQVNCVDFNKLADRIFVSVSYSTAGQTLRDIVEDLVNVQGVGNATLADEGVTIGGVQEGPIITEANFNYVSLRRAFDDLKNKTGFNWDIDKDKVLNFFDRATYMAPFSIGIDTKNHTTMHVKTSRKDYRNLQVVRAGQQVSEEKTETFKGDGEQKTFNVKLPVANDEAAPPKIYVDSVQKTVGIQEKDDEASFDWFYQRGERQITQQIAATALSSAQVLKIEYNGYFPIRIINELEEEIAARAAIEGGSGEYGDVETDEELNTFNLAIDKSDELLRRYGRIPTVVEITTGTFGLMPGHLVSIENPGLGVSGTFLVDSVTMRDLGAKQEYMRCRVSLLDGDPDGGWVEFFRKMIQSGVTVAIRENEVPVYVRKKKETITLSDLLDYSTDPGDLGAVEDDPYTAAAIGYKDNKPAMVIGFSRIGPHPLA